MTFKRTLGVAALLATAVAFAQPQPAQPASPDTASAAAQTTKPATGGATVTPLASTTPAPTASLTDAHALAKPGDATAGQTKAAACGACHGMDGNSADAQYPKLAAQHERYIARQLALFQTGERPSPVMMGFAANLKPQDMRDVGAWFASQKTLPGVSDDTAIKSGPNQGKMFYQVGEQIYRGGDAARSIPACMACHGPTGAGNPGPAYPTLCGQHAAYVSARLTAFRGGLVAGKGDFANPVMAGVAKNLTDEEIQALATYVNGLHPAINDIGSAKPAAAKPAPATVPAASPAASAGATPAVQPAHQH